MPDDKKNNISEAVLMRKKRQQRGDSMGFTAQNYFDMATALEARGNTSKAIDFFALAVEKAPDNIEYQKKLDSFVQDDTPVVESPPPSASYEEQETRLILAVRDNPQSASAHFALAKFVKVKHYGLAATHFVEAVALAPDNAQYRKEAAEFLAFVKSPAELSPE